MEHLGIDLGSRSSSICIIAANGKIRREFSKRTRELEAWFHQLPRSRIVLESCAESRVVALAALATEHDHEVCIVPTGFVRMLGVGKRRIKTDKRDARALAKASFRMGQELPRIHIKSDDAARAQVLLRSRALLVAMRTSAVNYVRSQMRAELLGRLPSSTKAFAVKLRLELPSFAEQAPIAAQLLTLDTLGAQIAALDAAIAEVASSEAHQRLSKISGVGPVVAAAFIATIDDPHRFASSKDVGSYLGLSPGENTTGGKIKRTGIIASGQKQTRMLLIQAAHSMMNTRRTREPMARWAEGLQRKKGRQVAVAALARRLAVVMWAMLRDGKPYDPILTKPDARHVEDETSKTVFEDLVAAP